MIRFKGKVSFIKRPDGTTHARARYKDKDGNKKDVWRKVVDKKSDAKDAVITEIERILNLKEDSKTDWKFAQFAKYYKETHVIPAQFIDDVKVAGKKSWRVIHCDVDQLESFFGKIKLSAINRDSIQQFRLKRLAEPVRRIDKDTKKPVFIQRSLASVNHELRTLRAMLNVALANDWIVKLPNFAGLISAASENKREIIPTEDEFLRILRAVDNRKRIHHIKPIILMIADCGARPVELWNLKWENVDFEANQVTLISDKGKKRLKRKVGLTERVKEALLNIDRISESVFNTKAIKSAWKSVQTDAGVPHLTPYHLRHLFASRLDAMGVSDFAKMKLMGHSQIKTTEKYVKLFEAQIAEITEQLNQNPYLPLQESETLQ